MKYHFVLFFAFITFSLLAQDHSDETEKGLKPVTHISQTSSGSTYAVVVGISDYQDKDIPDLRFADKDALAFAGYLQSPSGGSLDEDHMKVLVNERATQAQFGAALGWLWEVAGENDKVIIYFSGHGDVERKSITQPGYLLCWDAPSNVYMGGGAFNIRDLNDVVSTISIQNKAKVILITDACRAGKLSGSGIGGAQATAANLAKQYGNEIKILSCQPDEYSIEGEQWGGGRGAFSYHLLNGLYGMADGNEDMAVNLMEIRGYLEKNVSEEVAPQNQLPMTIGNGREKLTDVYPDILADLNDSHKRQFQLFAATDSRGIEDEVLAVADSNIVKLYFAFQKALEDKQFLFAEAGRAENDPASAEASVGGYADYFYEILSKEPQLEKLHSSMRRNYAAALQDDAQQVMNTVLKSGLTKLTLKGESGAISYKYYPAHLQRACELLGNEHYMYNTLQARKLYFKGISQKDAKVARILFHKALALEPDMPHAMTGLISTFIYGEQLDSAEYYFQKAIEMIPSWVEPYIKLSTAYRYVPNNLDKSEEIIRMAGKIDSSSVKVWFCTANILKDQRKYEEAVKFYKRVIEATAEGICFPCASNNLGWTYLQLNQYEEAEKYYKKAIQLDSSFTLAYGNLGYLYANTQRYDEAEKWLTKSIQIGPSSGNYNSIGKYYRLQSRNEKAKTYLNKGLSLDSTDVGLLWNLAWVIYTTEGAAAANTLLDKGIAQQTFDGNKAILLYVKGFLEYYSNHPNESLVALRQAAVIYGKYQPFVLAIEKLVEKDYENAAAYFEKAMEKNPRADNIKYIYCQLKIELGDLEGALDLLEIALSIGGRTYDFMSNDPKLEPLRQMPRYHQLMKKYFPEHDKK